MLCGGVWVRVVWVCVGVGVCGCVGGWVHVAWVWVGGWVCVLCARVRVVCACVCTHVRVPACCALCVSGCMSTCMLVYSSNTMLGVPVGKK